MPYSSKSLKEIYVYPAIFTREEGGFCVDFPDVPGASTSGDSMEEAVLNAKEVLSLSLYAIETDGGELPKTSEVLEKEIGENQFIMMIDVWMPYYRSKIKTHYVKKTLTIPSELNALAEERKINFSRLLRKALAESLGVKE